jgi:hypothetical protein
MCGLFRTLPVLTLALVACSVSPASDIADAQQRYRTARDRCIASYPDSLVLQSDCRAQAANIYIRPYYRYGDLMTWSQQTRSYFAGKVDRHEMSHAAYDRKIARTEREVAREEDARNALNHTASSYVDTPFTSMYGTLTRIFQ